MILRWILQYYLTKNHCLLYNSPTHFNHIFANALFLSTSRMTGWHISINLNLFKKKLYIYIADYCARFSLGLLIRFADIIYTCWMYEIGPSYVYVYKVQIERLLNKKNLVDLVTICSPKLHTPFFLFSTLFYLFKLFENANGVSLFLNFYRLNSLIYNIKREHYHRTNPNQKLCNNSFSYFNWFDC